MFDPPVIMQLFFVAALIARYKLQACSDSFLILVDFAPVFYCTPMYNLKNYLMLQNHFSCFILIFLLFSRITSTLPAPWTLLQGRKLVITLYRSMCINKYII